MEYLTLDFKVDITILCLLSYAYVGNSFKLINKHYS